MWDSRREKVVYSSTHENAALHTTHSFKIDTSISVREKLLPFFKACVHYFKRFSGFDSARPYYKIICAVQRVYEIFRECMSEGSSLFVGRVY